MMDEEMSPGGVKWHRYLIPSNGGLLATAQASDFIVARDASAKSAAKQFAAFPSARDFAVWHGANTPNPVPRCFYEVAQLSRAAKPFLDIDLPAENVPGDPAGRLNAAKAAVSAIAAAAEAVYAPAAAAALVCSSCDAAKFSFHVVVDGIFLQSTIDHAAFADSVVAASRSAGVPEWALAAVDHGVYHSTQLLRMLWSRKASSTRVKEFSPELSVRWRPPPGFRVPALAVFLASCLTVTDSCNAAPIHCAASVLAAERRARAALRAAPLSDAPDADPDDAAAAVAFTVAEFLSNGFAAPFELRDGGAGGKIPLKRTAPSMCPKCRRVHEHENPFIVIRDADTVLWHCGRARRGDGESPFLELRWRGPGAAPWGGMFIAAPVAALPLPPRAERRHASPPSPVGEAMLGDGGRAAVKRRRSPSKFSSSKELSFSDLEACYQKPAKLPRNESTI